MTPLQNDLNIVSLRELPLFSELRIEELREISHFSSLRRIKKHGIIFLQGDSYKGFFIVFKGKVKVYKSSIDGKESIIHLVEPFDLFADVPLFDRSESYPVCAEALEDTILFFIPKEEFILFLKEHPPVCFKIIAGFAKKMRALTKRIEDLTLGEISNKLAKYIMAEYEANQTFGLTTKKSITLSISKSTLAGYLGTITETLSRTFKRLQNEGVIEVNGKKIVILNFNRLKELAR